jgi:hypothetical protein
MNPFLLPVISMVFGIQVFCHQSGQEWQASKTTLQLPAATVAFYRTDNGSVHLGPFACKNLATPTGAWILAHELGHHWQAQNGLPYDEKEADTLGDRNWSRTLKKICEVRRCGIAIKLGG